MISANPAAASALILRPVVPADALEVARVHVRAWQQGYRGLLPQDYLDRLRPEDRASQYTFGDTDPQQPMTIVAVDRGYICGFASVMPSRDTPGVGELCALYVDPVHWNRGIGVALVSAARGMLSSAGFASATLWILAGNTRAERFYRRDGWLPDGAVKSEVMWGAEVNELRFVRSLNSHTAG